MYVAHLSLRDFRSYESAELPLEPGVTAFVGPNGQGKTNLLEAVGYVATLGSHRVATDAPLVRSGADRAVVRAAVHRDGRGTLVEIEINPGKANRARVNQAPVSRVRDVLGNLRVVLFSPDDIALVKGDPAERRRFLDETLVARAPRYAGVRADYDRVLKQRNALLKSATGVQRGGGGLRTLDAWDAHLARVGAELIAGRLELIAALRPLVQKAHDAFVPGGGTVELVYVGSLGSHAPRATAPSPGSDTPYGSDVPLGCDRGAIESAMLDALSTSRRAELERGMSLVGPHRDELLLRLGDLPARGYASHGESWSLALALRLAAYELLRGDGGEPVLLLDDVFAELDTARRDRLADLVARSEQVLVTAAVAADVPEALAGARVDVTGGKARRVR